MPSLLVIDNVFRVGASVRTFVELQNALHLFEQQTIVSFIRETPELRTRQRKQCQTLLKKHRHCQFDSAWQIWTKQLFQNGGVSLG